MRKIRSENGGKFYLQTKSIWCNCSIKWHENEWKLNQNKNRTKTNTCIFCKSSTWEKGQCRAAGPEFGMLLSASVPNRKSLAGRSLRYYGESEGITLTFGEGCRSLGNNTASRCPISSNKACGSLPWSLAPSLTPFLPWTWASCWSCRETLRERELGSELTGLLLPGAKLMLSQPWAAETVGFRVANSNWYREGDRREK